jgi:hypothetical protein
MHIRASISLLACGNLLILLLFQDGKAIAILKE